MKAVIISALSMLGVVMISSVSIAQPQQLKELHVDCTTPGTSPGGAGQNCADRGCTSAPEGFVIIRDKYVVTERSNNGGWYGVEYSDPVEVLPGTGITQPTTVCITVGANSKGGIFNAGSRGWIDVVGNGSISKFK
jgi:hypothetical protein